MSIPTRSTVGRLLILLIPILGACDSGTEPAEVGDITLAPVHPELAVGNTVQLVATVVSKSGSVLSGHPVTWTSTQATVASVTSGGLVRAEAPGTATIRATAGGQSTSLGFTILPAACTGAAATTTLALGETRTDSLGGGGCVYPQHWVSAVGYRFDVPTATSIRLQLASASFDALLLVTDPYMNLLFWDDDGGGGTDARIHRRFAAGEYIVWVTGYWPGSSGPYEVSAAELEIELCPTVGELQPGQSVTGALAVTDCASLGGRYADPWALSLSDQATLRIDLTSSAFDTFLIVEDEYGEVLAFDDDGGEGFNSRLTYTFPAGEFRVVVTSYGYGETGAYQLSAQVVAGNASADPTPSRPPWPGPKTRKS
jgi:hypothetical protein